MTQLDGGSFIFDKLRHDSRVEANLPSLRQRLSGTARKLGQLSSTLQLALLLLGGSPQLAVLRERFLRLSVVVERKDLLATADDPSCDQKNLLSSPMVSNSALQRVWMLLVLQNPAT